MKKYRVTVILGTNSPDFYDLLVENIIISRGSYRVYGKKLSEELVEKELEYFYFPVRSTKIIPIT